ncbi:MAG: hypothetical protein Fues2KO_47330 [Fuerstiella sp.]
MANIDYTIAGNAQSAERAVDQLRARFDRLEQRLKNQSRFTRQNNRDAVSGFQRQAQALQTLVLRWGTIGAATASARAIFQKFIQDYERLQQLRTEVAETIPEVEIRTRNQGRFDDAEFERFRENVNRVAIEIPVTPVVDAFRASEELTSQGFKREDILSGDALAAFRELQVASNQFGSDATDSKEIIKALSTSVRNREGRDPTAELTAEDVREFTQTFIPLFEKRPIQLQDAIPLARVQNILEQRGLDNEEQFAAFTVALESLGSGDVAATGLQQTTAFLQSAATKSKQNELKNAGVNLDTTGFDLIGESFTDALQNLGQQLEGLSEEQQVSARQALFGARAQGPALALINAAERIRAVRKELQGSDPGIVQERIANFQQSSFADRQRTDLNLQVANRRGLAQQDDLTSEDVQKLLNTVAEDLDQQGKSSAGLRLSLARLALSAAQKVSRINPQEQLEFIDAYLRNVSLEGDASDFVVNPFAPLSQIPEYVSDGQADTPVRDALRKAIEARSTTPNSVPAPELKIEAGPGTDVQIEQRGTPESQASRPAESRDVPQPVPADQASPSPSDSPAPNPVSDKRPSPLAEPTPVDSDEPVKVEPIITGETFTPEQPQFVPAQTPEEALQERIAKADELFRSVVAGKGKGSQARASRLLDTFDDKDTQGDDIAVRRQILSDVFKDTDQDTLDQLQVLDEGKPGEQSAQELAAITELGRKMEAQTAFLQTAEAERLAALRDIASKLDVNRENTSPRNAQRIPRQAGG